MNLSKTEMNYFINTFKPLFNEVYGWNIGKLLDKLVIQHGNFHFVINSANEIPKVCDMMANMPSQKTRDLWHTKVKEQLSNIERAKALLADYKMEVVCEFSFKRSPMSKRSAINELFENVVPLEKNLYEKIVDESDADNHSAGF